MAKQPWQNTSSHPPLWRWTPAYFGGPPPGRHSRPEGVLPASFPRWRSWKKPLQITIWNNSNAEVAIRIRARGWEFEFPPGVAIQDVLLVLNGRPPRRY